MISAEAKEAMYDKPADTVELKCEESKTKVFDAPTPFEDKLYAFVLACEILVDPSKREFILEHSQEILDAAKEQIEKEETAWSEDDDAWMNDIISKAEYNLQLNKAEIDWLKSLKDRVQPKQKWSGEDERMCQETIDWFEKKCFPYALEHENPARESIKWLKSLKQRIGG